MYPKQNLPTDVLAEVKVGIDPKYANKMDTDFMHFSLMENKLLDLVSMIVATTNNWNHVFMLKANQAIPSRIL